MEYQKIVRAILSNRNYSVGQQISSIKRDVNPSEYKDALKFHPIFNKHIHKSQFFKTINEVHIKDAYVFTRDFRREYRWIVNIIENYFEEINSFMGFKTKFEYSFIIGDYDNARKIIREVESLYGVSLWSIEADLMIEEYTGGSEANWNKLSYYLAEIKNPIYEFIANSSSKRIESKLSHESFTNQFQNDIGNINADSMIIDFFVFKNFHVANYEYKYKNLESVLFVSNIFSIIDQYLILIDVIQYNVSTSQDHDKLFLPFLNKTKEYISNDNRITNIYNVINNKNDIKEFETNQELFKCLDLYYSGKYTDSLDLAIMGIDNSPLELEYYETYCKSLINLNLDFKPLQSSKFVNELLEDIFFILSFKQGSEEHHKRIFKTALLLMNMDLGRQISGLLSEIEGGTERLFITGILSSTFNSHKNVFISVDKPSIIKNFDRLINQHCFKVYSYKLGYSVQFEGDISESNNQNVTFNALMHYRKMSYPEVIKVLNSDVELNNISYYLERKMSLLYYSYINLDLIYDALTLFGNVFFNDTIVTRKLNFNDLYLKIKDVNLHNNFIGLIEYPILFSIIVKEYDLYEVFDEFMCSYDFYNIREINVSAFIELFSLKKVIYFLHNVAVIDTLKYSTDYSSISDVEEDRIYILNILIDIDKINKIIYEKELDEIYRINSVRKVLKEVDEGRLYIDVNSLKEIQIKKFKDDFKRFKEIEYSSSGQTLLGFNPSTTKNWDNALTEKTESLDKFNRADYLAFKSIYLESRENFLFSKEYGLDSCLSTRIRHGALKNHIRSVFEKLDLITSKSNDKYIENEVWQRQLYYYQDLNSTVQDKLKKFSKEVDEYTVYIVEKLIQIQTEKTNDKKDGLFTYNTTDELLYIFYLEYKEYLNSIESTIGIILNELVNTTLLYIQENISEAFKVIIPNQFQKYIDNLVSELRELGLPNDCQLIPNLIKSSTEIQNELEYLSEWFTLNTTSPTSLMNIETILAASIELTNKIHPLYSLSPKITIKEESIGYSNLIFVFNILLNNVIQHSKLENEQLDLEIIVELDSTQKYLTIKFANNLNPEIDIRINKKKLLAIKNSWCDNSNIERSNKEGESGYDKIKRILLYEAYAKSDLFDFIIDNNRITIYLFFPFTKTNQDEQDTNN